MTGILILAILLGIVIGGALTFAIVIGLVARSNRMGDNKGGYWSFAQGPLRVLGQEDSFREEKLEQYMNYNNFNRR